MRKVDGSFVAQLLETNGSVWRERWLSLGIGAWFSCGDGWLSLLVWVTQLNYCMKSSVTRDTVSCTKLSNRKKTKCINVIHKCVYINIKFFLMKPFLKSQEQHGEIFKCYNAAEGVGIFSALPAGNFLIWFSLRNAT